jgi:hypothetical protein
MDSTGAAAVGAAIAVSAPTAVETQAGLVMRDTVNCQPVRRGEIYEGVVGTGMMLIDVAKLRAHGLPKCPHCGGTGASEGPACSACSLENRATCEHCPVCSGRGAQPWFVDVLNPDGTKRLLGEDANFCRRLVAEGLKVMVDFTISTVHGRDWTFSIKVDAPKP